MLQLLETNRGFPCLVSLLLSEVTAGVNSGVRVKLSTLGPGDQNYDSPVSLTTVGRLKQEKLTLGSSAGPSIHGGTFVW